MRTAILKDSKDRHGPRHLWATLDADGTVVIEGQDLGSNLPLYGLSGVTEYEYAWTIRPADIPGLVTALGGEPGADPLRLLVRYATGQAWPRFDLFLEEHAIPAEFWSRFEDDEATSERGDRP